jgi:hypothetical protein
MRCEKNSDFIKPLEYPRCGIHIFLKTGFNGSINPPESATGKGFAQTVRLNEVCQPGALTVCSGNFVPDGTGFGFYALTIFFK